MASSTGKASFQPIRFSCLTYNTEKLSGTLSKGVFYFQHRGNQPRHKQSLYFLFPQYLADLCALLLCRSAELSLLGGKVQYTVCVTFVLWQSEDLGFLQQLLELQKHHVHQHSKGLRCL